MASFVRKRDGSIAVFDAGKIRNAMFRANIRIADEHMTDSELDILAARVRSTVAENETADVEAIQDRVEEALIAAGRVRTARAYIMYRDEDRKMREMDERLVHAYEEITFRSSAQADLKRENANIDTDSAMGTMLKYGSEGAKCFYDQYVIPADIARAHNEGDIHIHDKDFYALTETCCQIDLLKLFKGGFGTGLGYLREPKDIRTYASLACIAIQANQNEMHGGQSVPNFDWAMAPGVDWTFRKQYLSEYGHFLMARELLTDADRDELESWVKHGPYKKLTYTTADAFSRVMAEHVKEVWGIPAEMAEKAHRFAAKEAARETEEATYQAMEALVHNLNTMNSRAGAQVPFSSLNYGTDTSPQARLVMKCLLELTEKGIGYGETAIFPVQIFKVKEGVNYNPGDPNYDLFQLAIRVSAKRLFPNFSFLDAPFNLPYYRPGDYNTEVAYMGCRTRVMGNVADPSREITCGRGNLSFTSINLPRLGILAHKDIGLFYEKLDAMMELCFKQLLHRFKIQCSKKVYNYPFLMGQGVWIDSEKLSRGDSVADVLRHGTLSVGFIGLAETLVALTGHHHGESEESWQLGYEIISHMREKLDAKSRETGLNFTLLATPAEGLSGRFVKIDAARFGKIPGVTDREYYTNSFHIPVYYPISAYKKIKKEAPFHALTNAGHISYVELDGDVSKNLAAFEAVVRCMKEAGIGYGSVNHPVDRDPVCGYNGIIDEVCPRCGRRAGEGIRLSHLKKVNPAADAQYGRFNH